MRRREFINLVGGVATWPLAVRAQQVGKVYRIGFLRAGQPPKPWVEAFKNELEEQGFIVGQNVLIEFKLGSTDQLSQLAEELVRSNVAVILASGAAVARAAKAATSTIPIVFVIANDPVEFGLVASLNRPGGNLTGVNYLSSALGAKRLEFLHRMVPAARSVAVLLVTRNPLTEPFMRDTEAGAAVLGLQLLVSTITSEQDLDGVLVTIARQRPGALVVGPDPIFTARREQIVRFAARHKLPAIYTTREVAEAGGLMAWGVRLADQYRVAGTYVGKILKGAKPADLPVLQATKFELVINLKTAMALGIEVPPMLLVIADEIIE